MLSHSAMDAAPFVWSPHKLSDLHRKCNYRSHWKRLHHYKYEWFVFFPFFLPATIFSSDWGSELQMNGEEYEQFSRVHMSHFTDPKVDVGNVYFFFPSIIIQKLKLLCSIK